MQYLEISNGRLIYETTSVAISPRSGDRSTCSPHGDVQEQASAEDVPATALAGL